MKRLFIFASMFLSTIVLFSTFGCMDKPIENQSFKSTDTTLDFKKEAVADTSDNRLSLNELLKRLENGEIVYYDEINESKDDIFALFNCDISNPKISKSFSNYDDLEKYSQELMILSKSYSRNISFENSSKAVYITELDNGNYYAVALCNNRKKLLDENGIPVMIENTVYPKTEKNDSIRPVVFAVIEKGGYEVEANNPSSNIKCAENVSVNINGAAETLAGGQCLRLCDITFPENSKLVAGALFVDPQTGAPCKSQEGIIILDSFTAQEFENSADGKALAVEINISYEENGYDKKTVIYAYLTADALYDCVKINSMTMDSESFVKKYEDTAAVYKINSYKSDRVLFYNDNCINNYTESEIITGQ
ncbi:MAG: hypothetical protein IJT49_01960 [Clostridia bacterium]|nr:hypothetical protein [Clostridia bacterium]